MFGRCRSCYGQSRRMVETGPSSTHTGTGPLAPGRFSPRNLFLISFSILFVEMAAIRWFNGTVTVLSYFNNLILISCFFGLGVGCLLARRRFSLILGFAPPFLALVLAVIFLQRHGIEISYTGDCRCFGTAEFYGTTLLSVSFSALGGVFLNACLFVVLGQEL